MVNFLRKKIEVILLVSVISIFYYPFFSSIILENKLLPIPLDTVVGLYHPYRDLYSSNYPNGIPFKNFLITDPVRQTFVWKELAINSFKNFQLPLWNPYEMAGKPLLANFQSGSLYPLNLILIISPFDISWSFFIISQSFLMGIFMYYYLKNLKTSDTGSLLGSLALVFSGFSISWLEWGNVIHTSLWLPLILLSIDKLLERFGVKWMLILVLSAVSSFLGGHLQTFFYITLISCLYLSLRIFQSSLKKNFDVNTAYKKIRPFLLVGILFFLLSTVQLYTTFEFISLSNRASDQNYNQEGWFLPLQNFAQLVAPDYFGNPATLNYYGQWNYAEFVSYIGVSGLILAILAILSRRDRKTNFFTFMLLVSFIFATKNFVSEIPFKLNFPFISTAQPTRLIFVAVFSLSVLCALGYDQIRKSKIWIPVFLVGLVVGMLWVLPTENKSVSFSNLRLPSLIFVTSAAILIGLRYAKKYKAFFILSLIVIFSFDLLRFGWKFTPFVSSRYSYPLTSTIRYINSQEGVFRVGALDRRILPPNFLTHYKIQSIEGYDPLYLKNYAEFIAVLERGKANIDPPFGYNRIITPHNYESQLFDFLNTEYVISLDEINSPKLLKVHEEGITKIYRNEKVLPRAFFVKEVYETNNVIGKLLEVDLSVTALLHSNMEKRTKLMVGSLDISQYSENYISIVTENSGDGFMVLSDVYYPTWSVYIDNVKSKIYETNHAFRGIFVPKGNHRVEFKNTFFK